jgi:hypothetical protein
MSFFAAQHLANEKEKQLMDIARIPNGYGRWVSR